MKKILSFLFLAITTSVMAQQALYQDFLNVRSIQVGTNSVGYAGLTNLTHANAATNAGMIYSSTNLAYTNASGTYIHPGLSAVVSAMLTTNQYTSPSIFKDVSLWSDRNGQPIVFTQPSPTNLVSGATNDVFFSGVSVMVEVVASAWLTNGAYGLQFRPIWDGETANTRTVEDWWVIVPTSAGIQLAKQHILTNAPLWRWNGAEKLRLINITNNVTTITGTASTVTNAAHITKIRLVGFRP